LSEEISGHIFAEFQSHRYENKRFIEIKNDVLHSLNDWTEIHFRYDVIFVASEFKLLFLL